MRTSLAITILLMLTFQLLFPITGRGKGIITEKVTLGLNDESLETAIKKIEQQTTFRFFYHDEDIKPLDHLNLAQDTRTVEQTLEILLQNTFLSFREMDNNILLVRKDQPAYFVIRGKVVNGSDKSPLGNASVFLSNATIGDKTAGDGTFTLRNVRPGKYNLIVSLVGFETVSQTVEAGTGNINLADILLFPKTILLNEVKIKPITDADRERNYNLFKDEFLGTSDLARECKILNPEVLDLDYDEINHTLKASSSDFLQIKNDALGYKIKYQVTNFSMEDKDSIEKKVYYEGPVFFEELKGTPSMQRRWQRLREEVYENSPMHFLRSALSNRIEEEGFRVQQVAIYANPDRPSDELIKAKVKLYKELKTGAGRDSLSFWVKKSKLPKTFQKLMPFPLKKQDLIYPTDRAGQYALGCDNDRLYVAYNKSHHFHINDQFKYLYNASNNENTLISFNSPVAFFNSNGVITSPYSTMYYGVWGRNRVAELLPIDYEPSGKTEVFAENNTDKNISGKLEAFLSNHITEKAYLHFDKPYYAAGDTIYFKAYVTTGGEHQLSNLSGVLHVDLINANNKIDQSIKLQLDSGVTWGDFALPDSLPKGNYRIRAYTRLMGNGGEDGYFDQTIAVCSIRNDKISESMSVRKTAGSTKPETRFLPESGSLVTGINAKIAFKAIGTNGAGINVKGVIVDGADKEVCTFASIHLGMGYFYLDPKEGQTYRAKISYPNGIEDMVDLPAAEAKGIVMSIDNDSIPKATVRIQANSAYYLENRNKDYTLLVYSGGIATTVTCKLDSPVITLDILKRRLHTGIAAVTLFSPTDEPICERLLFIQNYDRLNLDINSDKNIYAKREKATIKLNAINRAGNPADGHFSVSVTDESKVPVDENTENTILNNLLLTSDIKGYLEQPNYYFTDTSASAAKNLDVLMLTQGYRRFTWKQVLSNKDSLLVNQPEKGLEINGMVKNLFGKPIQNGTISLVPSKGGPVWSSVSDEKGIFHFSNLVFTDTTHFVLSAVNEKGRNTTKITYFTEKPEAVTFSTKVQNSNIVTDTAMVTYVNNAKKERNEAINYGRGKGIMLKEVKIRDIKLDDQYKTQSLAGAGHADQVMHADEIERIQGTLSTSLWGRLRGIRFLGGVPVLTQFSVFNNQPMLVIVDGAILNGDSHGPAPNIDFLSVNEVESVEVLKYVSTAIYGMSGANGVLIITTKQGGGRNIKDIASIGILPIAPMGFYKAREFYSPKYETTAMVTKHHDYRSTIYWNPELVTGKDGTASFDFYNADGKGTYRVVIEGIDDKGNLGRQVYRYKVE